MADKDHMGNLAHGKVVEGHSTIGEFVQDTYGDQIPIRVQVAGKDKRIGYSDNEEEGADKGDVRAVWRQLLDDSQPLKGKSAEERKDDSEHNVVDSRDQKQDPVIFLSRCTHATPPCGGGAFSEEI